MNATMAKQITFLVKATSKVTAHSNALAAKFDLKGIQKVVYHCVSCYLPNVCLELSQSYTKKMLSGATVNAANGDVSMVCTKIQFPFLQDFSN